MLYLYFLKANSKDDVILMKLDTKLSTLLCQLLALNLDGYQQSETQPSCHVSHSKQLCALLKAMKLLPLGLFYLGHNG